VRDPTVGRRHPVFLADRVSVKLASGYSRV
jgi:hypothetical protein